MSLPALYTVKARLFIFLCILSCAVAKGQPVPDFRAKVTEGCAPLVVQFTDLSIGKPTEWFWDFGNGNTSTKQNPGAVYFSPGKYNVKLVVKNTAGRDSVIKNNYIIVNKSPVVNFAAANTSGCLPFTVQFSDQSTGGSGTIRKWEWDFGDGTTSVEQSPLHIFKVIGNFTITLKVTNILGCVEVLTKISYIKVNPLPKASFTSGSDMTCKPPVKVNFTNTSTGGTITNTTWDFGDGTSSSQANPSHTFTKAGTYRVALLVTNQNGCVDTITKPTVIGEVIPGFTGPDVVCQGAPANFINTSSPAIQSALWNFGDSTFSIDINPVKRFSKTGIFTVKLVNNFGACNDSISKSIQVLPKPNADFSFIVPASTCKLPVNVPFTARATAAISYLWDFGDGGTSVNTNPTHTYTAFGIFSVKLTVFGTNGCTDTIVKQDIVSIVPTKIKSLNDLPYSGCVPRQQTFGANITSKDSITSYLWNFGDGNISSVATPVHNYTKEGKYDVSLRISTVNGCSDSLFLPAAIVITEKPKAGFSAFPKIACASETVQFKDSSAGTITARQWEFGDGETSSLINPLHHYKDTGPFTVKLIVFNNTCADSLTTTNYIYINPPIAKFSVALNCDSLLTRRFQNKSVLAQTNEWNFGDGSPISTVVNPVHTYDSAGVYIVHLHVTNNNCTDDFTDTIKIVDEHPNFTVSQPSLCRNTTTVLTAININPDNIASYSWDLRDNTPVFTGTDPVIYHNFVRPGLYSPLLSVKDKLGCIKTVERPVSIEVYGPNANFESLGGGCVNTPVIIKDRSQATANHPITSWILNYGDGSADTTNKPAFSHTYTVSKIYDVFLIVTDSYGCVDTFLKSNAINITNPIASFSLPDSISCKNSNVNFNNLSNGVDLSYLWDYGDGVTDSSEIAIHSYSLEGTYDVSLAIKDRFGCINSIKKPNAILIRNATSSFTLSDSIITCPPAQVMFKSDASFFTSIKWDFDDANFADIQNPSHYFSTARTYKVKLIAYGHGNCIDTSFKTVIVKGPNGSLNYSPVFKCVPASINFASQAGSSNNSFIWDFGDGTTMTTFEPSISHLYTTTGKFLPKLLLVDTTLNCKVPVFGADSITVSGALPFIKAHQNIFCDSAGLQFFDSSTVAFDTIANYQWNFGDGAISNDANPYHNYNASGLYPVRLVIKTTGGCIDSSENTFVKIVKSPQIQIDGPGETCIAKQVTFLSSVQPDTSAIKWNWLFGNGSNYMGPSPPPQTFITAGNYNIETSVTNSSGCTTSKTKVLVVNPLPNVNAGNDSAICRGATITLQPTGADKYLWANSTSLSCTNCSNPVASPVDTLVYYTVTGTNAITSCQKTDSIQIKVVQPFKIYGIASDSLCRGESVKLLVVGADHYNWTPSTGLSDATIANPVAKPDSSIVYSVTGHDYLNCFTDVISIPVTVYPVPVFNIINDKITIQSGSSVNIKTISSADVTKWQWLPTTGLSCSNCESPVATPANTIVYKAIATNAGGCKTEDRITIEVVCNNGNVFVPNTFSPNNDGSNDLFYPRGKGISGIKSMLIFNRWGAVVFQKSSFQINDPTAAWDGTYNGKPADADVFVYQLEVICETGQVFTLKGDVTLIR